MTELAGCRSLAKLLAVPITTMQNWVNRDDFPEPVGERPRTWSIDAVRTWVASRPLDHRSKTVAKGGLPLAEWDDEPLTVWMLYKRLNLPSETAARQLVDRLSFPPPLAPRTPGAKRQWDRQQVAQWLSAHRSTKVLRYWVDGDWREHIFILEPGKVDLLGVAQILGVSESSAKWYAHHEPTFPDEGPLGQWDEEDVIFWRDFEAPESSRAKFNAS